MMRIVLTGSAVLGVLCLPGAPVRAGQEEDVRQAIQRGVAFLRKGQTDTGGWNWIDMGAEVPQKVGMTALVGLTLLECGVGPKENVIQRTTAYLRDKSLSVNYTYALALSILYFDRLGDPADDPIIQALTLRLLSGQAQKSGGWTYNNPQATAAEVGWIQAAVKQQGELVGKGGNEEPRPKKPRDPNTLPAEVRKSFAQLYGPGNPQAGNTVGGDNSNTQFAILALWVAQRHGFPVHLAMAAVEQRFRRTQALDGGWSYDPIPTPAVPPATSPSSVAMTCCGLIGLGMAHGIANEAVLRTDQDLRGSPVKRSDPAKDAMILKGLTYLATQLGGQSVNASTSNHSDDYYTLWSLERAAVAYDLKTIGDQDWYAWGADLLLRRQASNGGWPGKHQAADTCFALLFLRRANLAEELTTSLRGKVFDPGRAVLRAGGVGGVGLVKRPGEDNKQAGGGSSDNPVFSEVGVRAVELEIKRLSAKLVASTGAEQEMLLELLRDRKGAMYTEALSKSIPKLSGTIKRKARSALADRLARMTSGTLSAKLAEKDPEIRRAAALACAMKDDKSSVPRLIELLQDPDPTVARAAHAALKSLSNLNFGPRADADSTERANAVKAWKNWWNKHPKRKRE